MRQHGPESQERHCGRTMKIENVTFDFHGRSFPEQTLSTAFAPLEKAADSTR